MPRTTLYIGGLQAAADDASVRGLVGDFGAISEIRLATRDNGECRGFAYVTFESDLDAAKARVALDGRTVSGQLLRVAVAT
ncbi:hypothetical protein PPSIR1_29011 [Plesiocystis pacifica SIR-1]|uniref:RRM domain-containing protein n=1 Tax=Plesiocystis pacifica SIR-1 TaxID=391625 RepID=A6GEZ0_9BACT|nr:RNA-binding protein [Plesiocystis pacifica]EDM75582.1 hypothetical protein PPSIR1_29011 [Plesiocystis pacifica SIR-1]